MLKKKDLYLACGTIFTIAAASAALFFTRHDGASPENGIKAATSCTQDDMREFRSFTRHFSDSSSFACVTIAGRQILLVSQETFGEDRDSDMQAVAASLFALDPEGGIVSLGSVRSQGTLYPVSLLDDRIMVAGHHFVYTYSIRGDFPELVLESFKEGDSPELDAMFRTFESGTPVLFNRDPASVQGAR